MAITSAQIQELYVAYLGRAADKEGLDYWSAELNAEPAVLTLENLRANFVNEQAEYTDAYAGLTRTETVSKIYLNLFGRAADDVGLAYWTTGEGASVNVDQLLVAFVNGASAADALVVSNKVFVAQTYTSTAGADFNATTAAAVIADVDGTSASVAVALENLSSGSLAGQVPGVGLINDLAAAQTAQASFATANQAAVEALAEELELTLDSDDSFDEQLDAVQLAAGNVRTTASAETNTAVLALRVQDAQKDVEDARGDLSSANKTLAATFEAAYAKNAALEGAAQNDIDVVLAGLEADGDTQAVLDALDDIYTTALTDGAATTTELYDFYVLASTSSEDRAFIDDAFTDADIAVYSNFKAVAVTDVAKNAAAEAATVAETALETAAADSVFTDAVQAAAAAAETYTNAKTADVNKAAVDAIDAGRDDAFDAVTDAGKALEKYNETHTDTQVVELASVAASATVKEAFYFADKVTAADDFTIGTAGVATSYFGAGDAIVLGTSYSSKDGALSTGDNNVLEFFLVKTDTGTQVVIETTNYGSGAATVNATTGAVTGDNLAVITLTGVTVDQLSVADGVISFA